MLITLSAALSWLTEPAFWFLLVQVAGLVLLLIKKYRAGTWTFATTTVLLFAVTELPVPRMLIRPLEQAIPAPSKLPEKIDGIVVLGGATDAALTEAYKKPQLNAEAERLTELIVLARQHPEAKIVVSGGALRPRASISEADVVRLFLEGQGFDSSKVVFETESRTTHENASNSYQLMKPGSDEHWVLITSAAHMPRAYGVFKKLGWNVIPYPVSYTVLPRAGPGPGDDISTLNNAVHEWLGIAMYRLTGRM